MSEIIGLYSSCPQSGKSSIANYLSVYNFKTVSFARPLKQMVRSLISNLGYSPELVERFMTEAKEEAIPNLGVSARHLMRTLGTEWGRDCVHPDVWNRCWRVAVDRHTRNGHHVVVDDVRFPNEAALIRQIGGQLWRIHRPDSPELDASHRSDGALDDFAFDRVIDNDGTLLDLYAKVDAFVCPQGLCV